MARKTRLTLLDYLRSFESHAPIPPAVMTAGELVEILEELRYLRRRAEAHKAIVEEIER